MKAIRINVIIVLLITLGLVACSTTRKTVKTEETLTQISEIKTDSGSVHATVATTDSTRQESWEEIIIEWEKDSLRHQQIIDDETTELEKMINALQKSGATRATIRKGQNMTKVSTAQSDSTATKQTTAIQQTKEDKKVKEKEKTSQRPGWWFVLSYVVFVVIALVFIYLLKTVIKRI